jgi:hypothetical protein
MAEADEAVSDWIEQQQTSMHVIKSIRESDKKPDANAERKLKKIRELFGEKQAQVPPPEEEYIKPLVPVQKGGLVGDASMFDYLSTRDDKKRSLQTVELYRERQAYRSIF